MKRIASILAVAAALVAAATFSGTAGATGYCLNGKFLDLAFDQPRSDSAYEGAMPAYWYQGIGLTCQPLPRGYAFTGEIVNGGGVDLGIGTLDEGWIHRRAEPVRIGYCKDGLFRNLAFGQPTWDAEYQGYVPAFYVQGSGLACAVPAGGTVTATRVNGVGKSGRSGDWTQVYPYVMRG